MWWCFFTGKSHPTPPTLKVLILERTSVFLKSLAGKFGSWLFFFLVKYPSKMLDFPESYVSLPECSLHESSLGLITAPPPKSIHHDVKPLPMIVNTTKGTWFDDVRILGAVASPVATWITSEGKDLATHNAKCLRLTASTNQISWNQTVSCLIVGKNWWDHFFSGPFFCEISSPSKNCGADMYLYIYICVYIYIYIYTIFEHIYSYIFFIYFIYMIYMQNEIGCIWYMICLKQLHFSTNMDDWMILKTKSVGFLGLLGTWMFCSADDVIQWHTHHPNVGWFFVGEGEIFWQYLAITHLVMRCYVYVGLTGICACASFWARDWQMSGFQGKNWLALWNTFPGWWQLIFFFNPTWGNDQIWFIFFGWVGSTTN